MQDEIIDKWQSIVNVMAQILNVPAGLIMRINGPDIEVLVSSQTEGNPYHRGDKEKLIGSGLYCETVIKSRTGLLIPNSLADEKWKENPDVKLNMISYLGFPIFTPTGDVFGTICVLDNKGNAYSQLYKDLILQFKGLVETHLDLLHKNNILENNNNLIRTLYSHLVNVREEERKRIAMELHDDFGQTLVLLKLQLGNIERELNEESFELCESVQMIIDSIQTLINKIRNLYDGLTN